MEASDNSNVNFGNAKCSMTNYIVTCVSGSIGIADNVLKVKFEVWPEGMLMLMHARIWVLRVLIISTGFLWP